MRVMGRETTAQKRDIELLDAVYRRGLLRFVERIGTLDESLWKGQAGEGFHRVLAHLAVAQENGLQLIRGSLAGRIALPLSTNGAAADSEADFANRPSTGLLALIEEVVDQQLKIALSLPDDGLLETPAIVPEWRRPGTLGHLYDHLYVHLVFHYQEIRSEVGSGQLAHWFEAWMPEASNDFYDRLFRVLPLVYDPEGLARKEIEKADICVDLAQPGGGRWTLSLDARGAQSEVGCEGETGSTIKAKPRDFFDFVGGYRRKVKISGNSTVSRDFRELFPLS